MPREREEHEVAADRLRQLTHERRPLDDTFGELHEPDRPELLLHDRAARERFLHREREHGLDDGLLRHLALAALAPLRRALP
jgi:hypothetical protein